MYDVDLKYFKLNDSAIPPCYSTIESACFDVSANFSEESQINMWDPRNFGCIGMFCSPRSSTEPEPVLIIPGRYRAMIPTGIVFEIPVGYSVRLHPRSGLSIKNGINLANNEAIIDSDYRNELMVLIHNMTDTSFYLRAGSRICQGELVKNLQFNLTETKEKPGECTHLGFGSTGL